MSRQTWNEVLITSEADGPTLATFTTAASILPLPAVYTLPANYFDIGRALRLKAQGRMSSFTSGTFTFQVMIGAVIGFTSGALTTVVSLTNQSWDLEITLTCRAIGGGTSANLMGVGRMTSSILTGGTSAAQAGTWILPTTAPVVGTGFNSAGTNVVDLFAACSVSNAANAITCHQYMLESLN